MFNGALHSECTLCQVCLAIEIRVSYFISPIGLWNSFEDLSTVRGELVHMEFFRLHISFTSWTSFIHRRYRFQSVIDIEISARKISRRITKAFFIVFSCCLQREIGTTRRRRCAKQMNRHPIFFWFLRRIAIFPPQKTKKISMLYRYLYLVEHCLYITHHCDRFATKPAEDTC